MRTILAISVVAVLAAAAPGAAGAQFERPPDSSTPRSLRWEGESVAPANEHGAPYDSDYASAGQAMLFWDTVSYGFLGFVVPHTATRVRLRVRGDSCEGPAKITFMVSRRYDTEGGDLPAWTTWRLLTTAPLSDTWQTYSFPGEFLPGTYYIEMEYTNNIKTDTCDRNLRWDYVEFAW